MRPSVIHTAVIGKNLPDIVIHCLSVNKSICEKQNIHFVIHKPQRDYDFPSPGIQIEFMKIDVLRNNYPAMFIDWEVELFKIPDLPECGYPYCGRWPETCFPDSFLLFTTSFASCRYLQNVYSKMISGSKTIIGSPYLYLKTDRANLPVYPDKLYNHYHTGCGGKNIVNSIDDLPPETLRDISETAKKWSGESWPVQLQS